ncbi:hypothetical protein [Mesorhizobium sp. SP-1A]|uniref:hypothetical protein n=1 Tax=Mesorhizobium sp. SP-1A TaxID=3077840 RepID=UPI0028F7232B|nr:hypothetical protein [Mesorhizobium sp. SP-1A]
MRDIDFLKLYASATGLRIMVLANRLGCETETERVLHDWVEQFLSRFITFTRGALAAERRVLTNTDPLQDADLDEELYYFRANYEDFWCEEGDHDLWDVVPSGMVGFRRILGQIHRDLRVFLSSSGLALPKELPPMRFPSHEIDPEDIDPECYEDLHGFDDDGNISAIYALLHGCDRNDGS